jgi:UPF0755 protein
MRRLRIRHIGRFFSRYKIAFGAAALFCIGVFAIIISASIAPSAFPKGTIVRIPKDATVSETAAMLAAKNIIRSEFMYKAYVMLMRDGKGVQAGSYLFDQPQSALKVAYRTGYGATDIQKIKVTIPEGSSSKEIASIIKKSVPAFNSEDFLAHARKYEGYLFPETYFFNPDVQPDEVISEMRDNFDDAIGQVKSAIATSTHSLSDIIIMASIVEEEANNSDDRGIISGILWKRIEIGMPLQVDAPFYYLLGKGSSELTKDDLAAVSSYNTYVNKGLPSAPISNPGIDSIRAALNPSKTPYLYYLGDAKGVTHYAATHETHVANKQKYLQ